MSEDTAQEIMDDFEKKNRKDFRRDFIARMEHKLHAKERAFRS
jgi:hypothetical protein